tara:strand:+ start:509 stop:691 length:183 start_codon:yes stop_codon:yes gene_type:complete
MNVTWVFVVYSIASGNVPHNYEEVSASFYTNLEECAAESVAHNAMLEPKYVSACMPIVED